MSYSLQSAGKGTFFLNPENTSLKTSYYAVITASSNIANETRQ